MYKASVIILAWNGEKYLPDCLHAVLAQDYPDFEVIVVDNGSEDNSAELVASQFPQVTLIRNEENLGFSGGNNVGMRAAQGQIKVLLNQDTAVKPGWLAALAQPIIDDPDVGVVGGRAYYPDGRLQHAGGYLNERGEGHHYGHAESDETAFSQQREVTYVTGAGLAISAAAYKAVGGLDDAFFPAYYEDVEWCLRVQRAGFKVVYAPQAVFIHKEESRLADASHEGMYLPHRNRLRMVLQHWPLDKLINQFLPAEVVWLNNLADGGETLVTAMHHVYLYHLLNLSQVLAGRRRLGDQTDSAADVIAEVLLTLRQTPTNVAGIGNFDKIAAGIPFSGKDETRRQTADTALAQIFEQHHLKMHRFESDAPLLGRLIAALRRQWSSIAATWIGQAIIQQQNAINDRITSLLVLQSRQQLEHDQHLQHLQDRITELSQNMHDFDRRLNERLFTYITENRREITDLALAIDEQTTGPIPPPSEKVD